MWLSLSLARLRAVRDRFPERPLSLGISLVHLLVLNAIVIAQPLLDQLARNGRYVIEQQFNAADLLTVLALLLTVVPMVLGGLECLLAVVMPQWRMRVHASVILLLAWLQMALLTRLLINSFWLEVLGLLDCVQGGLSMGLALTLTALYTRTTWGSRLVTWSACGLPIFVLTFLSSPTIHGVVFPEVATSPQTVMAHPAPVVLVVFDGLVGTALMDEQRQIDAVRYPNFARLAAMSHWFRNATTVHPRTDHAVPAILTGRFPVDGTSPVFAHYPQNLLALAYECGQYDCTFFEPFTRLAPEVMAWETRPSSSRQRVSAAVSTLSQVYLKILLPKNVAGSLPTLPRVWFSLPDFSDIRREEIRGLFHYSWDRDRTQQSDHFVETLVRSSKPGFWFGHIGLPHYPFRYYASGQPYAHEMGVLDVPLGLHGDLREIWGPDQFAADQAWQRYLLQVGAADVLVGRILDRLSGQGLLEECLLIVTADHGYSFRAGDEQRQPTATNIPDLMPVPLFVKRPGESSGHISDRNVESIDILPTIVDELQCELATPVDGESLFSTVAPRLRKTLINSREPILVEASFPRGDESRRRMLARFGSGREDRLWTLDVLPELIGQRLEDMEISASPPLTVVWNDRPRMIRGTSPPAVTHLLEGTLRDLEPDAKPIVLALTVDDRIEAVTRTLEDPQDYCRWSLLLPEHVVLTSNSQLALWEVLPADVTSTLLPGAQPRSVRLRRCETECSVLDHEGNYTDDRN